MGIAWERALLGDIGGKEPQMLRSRLRSWVGVLALMGMLVGMLALAPVGAVHAAGAPTHGSVPTLNTVTCSGYGCDGQDPVATGCWNGAYVLGGDPSYTQVLWSPACQSNYAYTPAPSGFNQVFQVIFTRAATSGHPEKTLYYCEKGPGCGPNAGCQWCSDFKAYIQPGWSSFQTDLLYAPSAAVQVCVSFLNTSNGNAFNTCSIWH